MKADELRPRHDDESASGKGSLWAELGLPEPQAWPEDLAPTVDRDLLLRLVRRELSDEATRSCFRLIQAFTSWRDAHAEVLAAEFRRTHRAEPT